MKTFEKIWAIRATTLAGLGAVVLLTLLCILHAGVSRAKAAISENDVKLVRGAIASYTKDRGHAPNCLDELINSGYLNSAPNEVLRTVKALGLQEHCR